MKRRIGMATATALAATSVLIAAPVEAAPAPNAEKRALLIGVSDYQEPTVDTVGSANDAREMSDLLLRSGWAKDNVRLLVDGDATAARIREGMDWLVQKSTPSSFSVFHYSGHTKQTQTDDGDNESFDELFWAVDNKFIPDGEFGDRMRALQGHAWINVSNCEAAGFDDRVSAPNRLFTAASREDQKGYERHDTKRSIFTGLITDAINKGRGDADRNGTVSVQEAFAYAAAGAPKESANGEYGPQDPQMAGGDNTQWVLKPPPPPPAPSLIPPGLIPPGLIPPGLLPPGILPPAPVTPQSP